MYRRIFNLQDIGYMIENAAKGTWSMSTKVQNCILKHMRTQYGLTGGDVNIQRGHGLTVYTFSFEGQQGKPGQVYSVTRVLEKGEEKGVIEIDPEHLEESLLPGEGPDLEKAAKRRLDKFHSAIAACKKPTLGAPAAPAGPAAAGAPADRWEMILPPAPAAAGAPRPGFVEPAPRVPARNYGDLEEMMGRMSVREGGRKKTRKSRRKSKKTLRRR